MKYKYTEIRRNRDENNIILTYSVQMLNVKEHGIEYWAEYNTLKEAKKLARYLD